MLVTCAAVLVTCSAVLVTKQLKGLDHLCPEDTPEDQMSSCPAIVPEVSTQQISPYMSGYCTTENAYIACFDGSDAVQLNAK